MPRPPKYPWTAWFGSKEPVHVDCAHPDYETTPRTLQIQALQQARKMDAKLTTRLCGQHPDCLVLTPTRRAKVNWERLLNGAEHVVWYSEIRPIKPASFVRTARAQAKKRGLTVQINTRQSEAGLSLQAWPLDARGDAAYGNQLIAKYAARQG